MELRCFGKRSGHRVPPLSIGSMRLPRDVGTAVTLLRDAIDRGLKYIDVSRGYGEAEWVIGRALREGYREKVILSTKWAPWIVKISESDDSSSDCVRRRIEESLRRLDVDYLDYYQIWNIHSREHYDKVVAKGGMLDGVLKAKNEGLVRHLGFTTHDSVENLLSYVNEADWCEVLLTTYNILNTEYAPVIDAAKAKGIGTVTMNPVAGGKLAGKSDILNDLAKEVGAISTPDMAIRYVLSNPNIDTMLNGIKKQSDLIDSIASIERGPLSGDQIDLINERVKEIKGDTVFCTDCKYCMPCPSGIDIPAVISCVEDARLWGWKEGSSARYASMKGKRAAACVKCGKCEKACTQKLKIIREMTRAVEMFESKD